MLMEQKKSFQAGVFTLAMAVAVPLGWLCRSSLPAQAQGAQVAVMVLMVGSVLGFERLLTLLLPPLLARWAPRLDDGAA